MITVITLPAEIRFVRLASLAALQVAEIFIDSLNPSQSDPGFCDAFELSVSEAFTNSVHYAEHPEQDKTITISFSSENNKLTVSVSDTNSPFNPDTPSPDLSSYPENGYGLFLIRQLMDSLSYKREEGTNRISMTKQAYCSQNYNP